MKSEESRLDVLLDTTCRSPWYALIGEIKRVSLVFSSMECCVISRQKNFLAHEVAATARRTGNLRTIADVPASIRKIMFDECNTSMA